MAGCRPGWGSSCLCRHELSPQCGGVNVRVAGVAVRSCPRVRSAEQQQQRALLAKQDKFIWRVPVSKFLTLHNKAHSHIAPQS